MLTTSAICSLDGYVADADGRFEWAAPDAELHAFVDDRERRVGTMLLGRRMHEVLEVRETWGGPDEPEGVIRDFAELWRAADKVVYSTTLPAVRTARTRLERSFDPAVIRRLVAESDRDVSVGGPHLAAAAWRAGLVDELELYLVPVLVGGGTRALPDGVGVDLEPVDERRFTGGAVYTRHRVPRRPGRRVAPWTSTRQPRPGTTTRRVRRAPATSPTRCARRWATDTGGVPSTSAPEPAR